MRVQNLHPFFLCQDARKWVRLTQAIRLWSAAGDEIRQLRNR
jgi:hypothetical protein